MTLSLLDAAAEAPERVALVCDGEELSFAALAPRVERAMAWLAAQGVNASSRVAVVGAPRLDTLLALYALFELGVPAVLIHPRYTDDERARAVAATRPSLLLDERWSLPAASAAIARAPVPNDRTLALVFTGGTTGEPKAAMLSRRAFLAAAAASARNLEWRDDDRWLLCMPVAHIGGLSIVTRCLIARRTVVVAGGARSSVSAAETREIMRRHRVTIASFVPTQLSRMMALEPRWRPEPCLRAILLGGAAAPPSLLARAVEDRLPVLTTYGLTEACSQVTVQRYGTLACAEAGAGEPLDGTELRIVDGYIEIKSATLMDGYLPPHPSSWSADGWLRTGDLGRLDERGRLHVLARRTDLIVSGGENVYPAEVEAVLERCPGIREACVVGIADDEWGQIVGALLVADATPPSDEALAAHLKESLAPFKRPRRIAFIESLPTTSVGKVDRRAAGALSIKLRRLGF